MIPLVLSVLSGYIIVLYLVYDSGPMNMFAIVRFYAGINLPTSTIYNDGEQISALSALKSGMDIELVSNGSFLAEMLKCHRCTGFWIGILVSLPNIKEFGVLFAIAAVGGIILVHELMGAVSDTVDAISVISAELSQATHIEDVYLEVVNNGVNGDSQEHHA